MTTYPSDHIFETQYSQAERVQIQGIKPYVCLWIALIEVAPMLALSASAFSLLWSYRALKTGNLFVTYATDGIHPTSWLIHGSSSKQVLILMYEGPCTRVKDGVAERGVATRSVQ